MDNILGDTMRIKIINYISNLYKNITFDAT